MHSGRLSRAQAGSSENSMVNSFSFNVRKRPAGAVCLVRALFAARAIRRSAVVLARFLCGWG